MVNSGWTRGASVPRCIGDEHVPHAFRTFCPKALGMREETSRHHHVAAFLGAGFCRRCGRVGYGAGNGFRRRILLIGMAVSKSPVDFHRILRHH